MSDEFLPEVPEIIPPIIDNIALQPYDIALIIDNTIYQILNVDGQFAAQLLAQPKFVQVAYGEAKPGWIYDESKKTFSAPDIPGL